MRRSREPFFWLLFSSGGMVSALVLPALVLLLWLAAPLGWVDLRSAAAFHTALSHPLVRLCLFGIITLSLFHWAHRFRFSLYDGLQLSHLWGLIAALCYGGATVLTVIAAYLLWGWK